MHIDLVRQLAAEGHHVYVACKNERRFHRPTSLTEEFGLHVLRIKTLNLTHTTLIEKGIATLLLEYQFINAIQKYWRNVTFDVVLYHTPPITFTKVIQSIQQRDHAKSYLLLKDIFPQNAVDLGMFSQKSLLYKYFRKKEQTLYAISDKIGCMSRANCQFLLKNNPEIDPKKVEISPNSTTIDDTRISKLTDTDRRQIRQRYGLPTDKTIFVYGGNFGKPQSVPFIIQCLKKCKTIKNAFFLMIGDGADYSRLEDFYRRERPEHVKVMASLPKDEYERLVNACNVGLVFLDYNFTIPNYPSRILSYMRAQMPILCVTDPVTDVGIDIQKRNCGWYCMSNDPELFRQKVLEILDEDLTQKGENSLKYLRDCFDVRIVAKNLINSIQSMNSEDSQRL